MKYKTGMDEQDFWTDGKRKVQQDDPDQITIPLDEAVPGLSITLPRSAVEELQSYGRALNKAAREGKELPSPMARNSDPDTSHEAARSMHVAAGTHRGMILRYLEEHGASTGDAIDEALGWRHATANRRLPELRKMNLIEMSDQTAVTRSGRRARMWRII